MTDRRDFLVEIGTEELPPKALKLLSDAFTGAIRAGLEQAQLSFSTIHPYATPRRLALVVPGLRTQQAERQTERRGPALKAAFDANGKPTKAALGFARSCRVEVDSLQRLESEQGAWLVHRASEPGKQAKELLPDIVSRALATLPIPKRMRWGGSEVEFVRPVHWVVLLLGDEVIETEILGVQSGRESRGHRFHHPQPVALTEPAEYAQRMEQAASVMVDFSARRETIKNQVQETATQLGGTALLDDDLVDEVTALVEWPVALSGRFEARFLELPPEVLISSMQGHQKYFPVVDADGTLLPHFITVSNIRSADPGQVIAGNERVIRPRLEDAAFFWNQDRKRPLAARVEQLKSVVFHEKLGSLHDKAQRVAQMAAEISRQLDGDDAQARRAARLGKCDLATEMVGEFPELQGIMGRYYAAADGESADVAQAITEQYQPRHAGDALPQTITGTALAIADKLDTLRGIFGIGQHPTGDKDPYALRRAALGVLRIMVEGELDLDLKALLELSAHGYTQLPEVTADTGALYDFMMERLRAYYRAQQLPQDTFAAVLARKPARPHDFHQRMQAVEAFRQLPAAQSLAAANKRIRNILRKSQEQVPDEVDTELLVEPAERALARALVAAGEAARPLLQQGDYSAALAEMARLREPVDAFFDHVMVMAEDSTQRGNRLALLTSLSGLFLSVADITLLRS